MRESDKQTGGDEAAIVLHALVGTATWLLLLVLLSHLWCLTSHLSGTCQRSVNLTCSHSHTPISIAPLSNPNTSKYYINREKYREGLRYFFTHGWVFLVLFFFFFLWRNCRRAHTAWEIRVRVLCFGGSVLYIRWARDEIQRLRSEHILLFGSDFGGLMEWYAVVFVWVWLGTRLEPRSPVVQNVEYEWMALWASK